MTRVLYYAQRSPYARKIRILLAEKNLACELKATDIANKSPEFIQISPIGKVPVLVDEDGTTIWDSSLIAEYLDETYPEPAFYPSDRQQRLECRKWEDIGDTLADNAVALWYQKLKGENSDPKDRAKYQSAINRLFPVLHEKLAASTYLLGDSLTAADLAVLCAIGYYSFRLGEDWQQQYPKLAEWFNNLHEKESVKSTVPVD